MKKRLFPLLLLSVAVAVPAAFADTVDLSLLNPTQTGPEGSVFTYQATVSAPLSNSGDEYLVGGSVTTSGGPLTPDVSDFFNNFPLFLAPGDSFTGDLFTLESDPGSADTTTLGTFVLQGGSDPSDQGQIGQASFSATVTPEPGSLLLLATGAMGGIVALRRRRGEAVL